MQSLEKIFEVYKQKRMTLTPERKLIIELLHQDTSHPTIDEIHQRARQQMPDIPRTLIYNTITELEAFGEITKLDFVDGSTPRFDPNPAPHNHLYCTSCHRAFDIDIDPDEFNIDPEKFSGFAIEKYQVTFYGICPDCLES